MVNRNPRPQWWQLYALLPLALGGLVWARQLGLVAGAEMVVQVVMLALTFGLIVLWLNANAAALALDGVARPAQPDLWSVREVLPPAPLPDPAAPPVEWPAPWEPKRNTPGTGRRRPGSPQARPVIAGSVLD